MQEEKIENKEETTQKQSDNKQIRVKLQISKDDDKLLSLLAKLLYAYKLIEKPTKSAAVSYCINFTANVFREYLKAKEGMIDG